MKYKNLLKRLYKIKLNQKIQEKETKKLVPHPTDENKIIWKGMRGDKAKEEAIKELEKELNDFDKKWALLDKEMKRKIYNPFKKESFIRFDLSIEKIKDFREKINEIYRKKGLNINYEFYLLFSGSDCERCKAKQGTPLPKDILFELGLFYITHPNCMCGIYVDLEINQNGKLIKGPQYEILGIQQV